MVSLNPQSEKLLSEIEAEIQKNKYSNDISAFGEGELKSNSEFDGEQLSTTVSVLATNWWIDPHINVSGSGFKSKLKRFVLRLNKFILEQNCEKNSRFNINTVSSIQMINAYIQQHEKDAETINSLKAKVDDLNRRLEALERNNLGSSQ